MNYSGVMLVGGVREERPSDGDDAVTAVALFPVQVFWNSLKTLKPQVRKKTECVSYEASERFPASFWKARHKETVLVIGEYRHPDTIEIVSVIDIQDTGYFSWE